jgi:rod shape-determining protein MreD
MSVRVATVAAVVAALLETSVAPYLLIAGIEPDIVLASAIVLTVASGAESGFVCAFLGGLILDMLTAPARPVGTTVIAMLLAVGLGAIAVRFVGPGRIGTALVLTFVLTFVYQLILGFLLRAVTGAGFPDALMSALVPIAVANTVTAAPLALVGRWAWLRYGRDRAEW